MRRLCAIFLYCTLVAACSQQPARESAPRVYDDTMPADLSGSWERDYWRGDDINRALDLYFRRLSRANTNQGFSAYPGLDNPAAVFSSSYVSSILALARLADAITRFRYFSISQTADQIIVEREDDFDIYCEFYDGVAEGAATQYGAEVCGWSGDQFVSRLVLPDGLRVDHRFTVADDTQSLHVSTTVSLGNSGLSFTLGRFYSKYDPVPSQFDCVDTLSRNRVCTTETTAQ